MSHLTPLLADAILLATLGTEHSDGAARVALAFASRGQGPMEALGVLAPLPPDFFAYAAHFQDIDPQRRAALSQAIAEQMARISASDATPKVEIGDSAEVIVNEATARGAALIALCLVHHGVVDRLLGAELAIQILHSGKVPVLTVPPAATGLMERIVIATDFSPAATRVAHLAMRLAKDGAAIHLVHTNDWLAESVLPSRRRVYEAGVQALLEQLATTLPLPPYAQVEQHLLHGVADSAILTFAAARRADLIAMAADGAEPVVRRADCSVLIAKE